MEFEIDDAFKFNTVKSCEHKPCETAKISPAPYVGLNYFKDWKKKDAKIRIIWMTHELGSIKLSSERTFANFHTSRLIVNRAQCWARKRTISPKQAKNHLKRLFS